MAANWCSGSWRERVSRASRSRAGAVVLSAVLGLASARCIADFLDAPKGGRSPHGPGGLPAPPAQAQLLFVDQPSDGAPGYPLDTVAVAAVDSAGRPASPVVSLALIGGPGTLGGADRRAAAGGVADFTALVVDSAGTYRLVALAAGFRPDTSRAFSIVPPPVATVTVQPGHIALASLGETSQASADVLDSASRRISGVRLDWSSSDTTVASVDAAGVVTARGNGTATIRAASGGVSGAADVTVAQVVAAVAIAPSQLTLGDQQSQVLTASAADARGNGLQRAVRFTWKSSRSRTIGVYPDPTNSARALIRRLSEHGSATITATTEGVSGTVSVH